MADNNSWTNDQRAGIALPPTGSDIYGQTALQASKMTDEQLAQALQGYAGTNTNPVQTRQQGILAMEYLRRTQQPDAKYNITDPSTGTTRPVAHWTGYDPTSASQGSWNALISGQPQKPWSGTPGTAPAGPWMQYDDKTGLPITNELPGMASSHFWMGGPDAQLWNQGQTYGSPPSDKVRTAPGPAAPQNGSTQRPQPLAYNAQPSMGQLAQLQNHVPYQPSDSRGANPFVTYDTPPVYTAGTNLGADRNSTPIYSAQQLAQQDYLSKQYQHALLQAQLSTLMPGSPEYDSVKRQYDSLGAYLAKVELDRAKAQDQHKQAVGTDVQAILRGMNRGGNGGY